MFTLVIGHSKAGKSRYAEALAVKQASGPLVYIATLIPVGDGEFGAGLVKRHRAQREGLGFETFEQPLDVSAVPMPANATVLLEDASNLVANNLFCAGRTGGAAAAFDDIWALKAKCEHLVAVSFYGLVPKEEYDEATNHYIEQISVLNERLKDAADAVAQLEHGEATVLKGAL